MLHNSELELAFTGAYTELHYHIFYCTSQALMAIDKKVLFEWKLMALSVLCLLLVLGVLARVLCKICLLSDSFLKNSLLYMF